MTLGHVRVMGVGVVLMTCVEEVSFIEINYVLLTRFVYYAVLCPSLTDPDNGMINCSLSDDGVSSYEDTCSFACNTGYELTGNDTRTCQSDGSWNGTEAMCRRGMVLYLKQWLKLLHTYYSKSWSDHLFTGR